MKLLLDTHTLLWFIGGSSRLSSTARTLIEDTENDKFVSIVRVWEIAIKVSVGRMSLSSPFDILFPHQLQINGFELWPVKVGHASVVASLPFHHRDPFDRLLIAQSIVEDFAIVTTDSEFADYPVKLLW